MDNESKNRKISFQDPSHFILKSFRNIDTLPDIIQLKPSQVIQYEVRNSSCKENQYFQHIRAKNINILRVVADEVTRGPMTSYIVTSWSNVCIASISEKVSLS